VLLLLDVIILIEAIVAMMEANVLLICAIPHLVVLMFPLIVMTITHPHATVVIQKKVVFIPLNLNK